MTISLLDQVSNLSIPKSLKRTGLILSAAFILASCGDKEPPVLTYNCAYDTGQVIYIDENVVGTACPPEGTAGGKLIGWTSVLPELTSTPENTATPASSEKN